MIVKVFKAASSFTGVNYNERKIENGKSELLVAENFSILKNNPTKADYIAYMERVCSTNSRVHNKQFHATISCKGREYSVEDLRDVALQYVDKMGYGKNPYLIYFHSDTDNNHVHIVSTRVDKQGNRMPDKMEGVRSQKIMNEIMNLDLSKQADLDIKRFQTYSFSSVQQFKLLLETSGWATKEENGELFLFKSRSLYGRIGIDDITKHIQKDTCNDKRQKQLAAILSKYKGNLSVDGLVPFMKEKFGVELKFFFAKGHKLPYGYNVIDHSTKSVFKGGEILPLKDLLIEDSRYDKVKALPDIISSIVEKDNCSAYDLQKSLSNLGYGFSMTSGQITIKGNFKPVYTVDDQLLSRLQYYNRLYVANTFKPNNMIEAQALAKMFTLHASDLTIKERNRVEDYAVYKDIMESFLMNSKDVRSSLYEQGYVFYKLDSDLLMIDKNRKSIINAKVLDIDISVLEQKNNSVLIHNTRDISKLNNHLLKEPNYITGMNVIDTLTDVLNQHSGFVQDDSHVRRKRKGQQQNN